MTLLTPTKTSLSEFYTAAAYSNTGLLLSPRSSRFCRTAKASAAACSPSAAFGGTSHQSAPVTAEDRSDHVGIKTRHPPSSPASSDVSLAAVTTPTKGSSGLRKECNLNRGSSATDNIPASLAASTFTPTASGSLMSQFQRQMALTPKRASPKDGRAATSAFSLLPLLNQVLEFGAQKSKITTYDRFIPNRDAMDSASSHFAGIKEPLDRQKPLDAEAIAYQEQLARACGVAIDQRILAYNVEPPGVERQDLRTTWNRPLRAPNVKLAKRRIPTMADKVLDAPGLIDDFYLSLLDWSSNNQLAIALDKSVYIWNADTGGVQEFCQTADDDFVTSLQWTADGSYLAIGTDNGDAQIWDLDSSSKIRTMRGAQ
ncbi:hypothetical protein BASA61_001545 [Batrachochytrium salamandrivorans]|nr:hypothetical protein BASA61_001545 [Batrachochytrium salamandrivorans]